MGNGYTLNTIPDLLCMAICLSLSLKHQLFQRNGCISTQFSGLLSHKIVIGERNTTRIHIHTESYLLYIKPLYVS